MTKRITIAAIVATAALAVASSASALTAWTNTPRNVENNLVSRWNTSDGEAIVTADCRGVWLYAHAHTRRGEEFHRLRCNVSDDLDRVFDDRVVIAGPGFALNVTELSCDDSGSDYACP